MKQKTIKPSPSRQEKTEREAERDRLERFARDAGRYLLEEAAEELARHTGASVSTMQDKLKNAALERILAVYKPGSVVRHYYSHADVFSKLNSILETRWSEEAYWDDLNDWLIENEKRITWRFPAPVATVKTVHGISPSDGDWTAQARAIADECFDLDTSNNCRDCLLRKNNRDEYTGGYAYRVMIKMQERKIHGPRGRIDNAATISREALQGKKWWANKPK